MKSQLFITVITIVISDVIGHNELSSSIQSLNSDSDSMPKTRTKMSRRMDTNDVQYEGIPIEFPIRRNLDPVPKQINPIPPKPEHTTSTPPAPDYRSRRIFNPDEAASVGDHPYMAAVLVNAELWCGAVIISSDSVLTAAHCLQLQYNNRFFREYVKMLSLRVGSTNSTAGGELYRVTEIFFHPNYKPQTLDFNVALVKVHKNMTFGRNNPKIDRIRYSRDRNVPVDSQILFLGWGSVIGYEGTGGQVLLQKVRLPVYDLADCQEVYGRDLVTRNNFCAGYITLAKNVCNHDAGGPAIMNGVLVGVLSFSSQRCDLPDQPAVFTTVGAIAPWLHELAEKRPLSTIKNTAIKTP